MNNSIDMEHQRDKEHPMIYSGILSCKFAFKIARASYCNSVAFACSWNVQNVLRKYDLFHEIPSHDFGEHHVAFLTILQDATN